MKRCATLLLAAGVLLLPAARARCDEGAAPFVIGGSVSARPALSLSGDRAFEGETAYGSTTTLGLDLDASGGRARASASLETAVLAGAAAQAAWGLAALGQARRDELLLPAYSQGAPVPETLVAARLRTLYLKLDLGFASLAAGRQVINYGRGALWCPTDVFTELDLSGLSPVRRGSDSLRFVLPFGPTESLEAAAAPTAAPADGRYALRARGLVGGVDCAAIAAREGADKAWVLGADFKADLEIGFYGIAAYALPDSGREPAWKEGLRAAGGADYSFGDFVTAAEYYFNGGGAAADSLFPDRDNLYASLSWKASELVLLSAQAIADLDGRSGSATLAGVLSAAQDATVQAYLRLAKTDPDWDTELGLDIEIDF